MNRTEIEEAIRSVLPKISKAKLEVLADLLEEDQPTGAERPAGHVVTEEVEYPYLTVGLDGNGNAVSVSFDQNGGWEIMR